MKRTEGKREKRTVHERKERRWNECGRVGEAEKENKEILLWREAYILVEKMDT